MYTEGKLLRVERPDTAFINSGLTDAEAGQLALDSYTNPVAFSELQVVCGIQYADREVLGRELAEVQSQQPVVEQNKAAYDMIWKMVDSTDPKNPHKRSFVLSAAHTGAAQALREIKADLQKQKESFYASAAAYSAEMAALCGERLDGLPLRILGRPFDYTDGYLSTVVSDKQNRIVVFFGPSLEVRTKERLVHQREPKISKRSNIKVVSPSLQDWGHLIQALNLVNQF